MITDNMSAHKTTKVTEFLAAHSNVQMHYTRPLAPLEAHPYPQDRASAQALTYNETLGFVSNLHVDPDLTG